ncbi:hypothetical protein C8J57DRAFT_1125450, partial [Mycena rebaudengoi]
MSTNSPFGSSSSTRGGGSGNTYPSTMYPASPYSRSSGADTQMSNSAGDPMFNMGMDPSLWNQMSTGNAGNMAYIDPRTSGASYGGSNYGMAHAPGYSSSSTNPPEGEIQRLYKRILDLEKINERYRDQLKAMGSGQARRGYSVGPATSTPQPTAAFMASWQARTHARIRKLCSINRAGNALCAWHDSRRERRAYPPHMAPDGYLNCGCSVDEALFEESLARHQIGSYLPGETARMDAALRNPLLKLLQARYGYRDGDFERDPRTGDWLPGQGPESWEQQLQSLSSSSRRDR